MKRKLAVAVIAVAAVVVIVCAPYAQAQDRETNTTIPASGSGERRDIAGNGKRPIPLLGASADLAITKTDGVTNATPGGSVTYTITASNAGPSNATGATVADTFPASLSCTWICVGAGGGTCTPSGSININDTVNLPAGGPICTRSAMRILLWRPPLRPHFHDHRYPALALRRARG
ncbi:MAG TPA: DUF11 domain-containing protein [Thermoanaerobaculia bacterium]|jgi:uncharacterized repeat protein (TIGR01451 family)|nr:DUF11 domain-containing protein [Thermoanaerobaculia bacterium]